MLYLSRGQSATGSEDHLTSTLTITFSALAAQKARQSVWSGGQEGVPRRRALEQQVELLQLVVAVQGRVRRRRKPAKRIGYLQVGEEPLCLDRSHVLGRDAQRVPGVQTSRDRVLVVRCLTDHRCPCSLWRGTLAGLLPFLLMTVVLGRSQC